MSRRLLLAAACLALIAVACDSGESDPSPPAARTVTPSGVASATPGRAAQDNAPGRESAQVIRIVDGDTVLVEINGRRERVRYIGINTPESVDPDRPVECFGKEAAAENQRLVEGKTVQLERDLSDRDDFDRLLRYVYVDGVMVNAELVRRGAAFARTYRPDTREDARLRDLQREAQQARRGLWGACPNAR